MIYLIKITGKGETTWVGAESNRPEFESYLNLLADRYGIPNVSARRIA